MRVYKNDYTNVNNYNIADCGAFGKAFESAFTGKRCKSANKVDFWHDKARFEIKTSASEITSKGAKMLNGVKYVIYCPVPLADADGTINLYKQEAFLLTRDGFINALEQADALREKTSTAGVRKVTIQTFWNRKQNKPHGALLYRLLDALYDNCEMTLEEMLEG